MRAEKNIEINSSSKIMANPRITLQEEPDHWGLLYDPRIDFSLGMNPESVFLWKQLENKTTIKEIAAKIKEHFTGVPVRIENDVMQLVQGLLKIGFATVTPVEVKNENHK